MILGAVLDIGLWITLTTLSLSVFLPNWDGFLCRIQATRIACFFSTLQTEAMAFDSDITITANSHRLVAQFDSGRQKNLDLGSITADPVKLGFTDTGNTKYAGTLTLRQGNASAKLTLSVGYGKVRIL